MRYCQLILLFLAANAFADVKYYTGVHTGGYAGMFAPKIGLHYEDIDSEVLFGYTPKFYAEEDLYSITSRNIYNTEYIYIGLGTMFSLLDEDTYYMLPDKYPKDYYPMTAIRNSLFVGYQREGWYTDISALDLYLETWYRSYGRLDPLEFLTVSFGYEVDFE